MATCQERGIVHMKDIFGSKKHLAGRNNLSNGSTSNSKIYSARTQSSVPVNKPWRNAPSPPPLRRSNDAKDDSVYTTPVNPTKSYLSCVSPSKQDTSAFDVPTRPPRKKQQAPQPPGLQYTQQVTTSSSKIPASQLSPSSPSKTESHHSVSQLVTRRPATASLPKLGIPDYRPPSPGLPSEPPPPIPTSPPYVPQRKAPPPPASHLPQSPHGPLVSPPASSPQRKAPSSPGYAKRITPAPNVHPGPGLRRTPISPPPFAPPPPPALRQSATSPVATQSSTSPKTFTSPRQTSSSPRSVSPSKPTTPRTPASSIPRPLSPPPPPPMEYRDKQHRMDGNHNFSKDSETESSLLSQQSERASSGYQSEFDSDAEKQNRKNGETVEEELTLAIGFDSDSDTGFSEPMSPQTSHSPNSYIYREYEGEDFAKYLKDDTDPVEQNHYPTEKRYRKRNTIKSVVSSQGSTLKKTGGIKDRLSKVFTLTRSQKSGIPRNRPASSIHNFSYTDSKSFDYSSDVEGMMSDTRSDLGGPSSYWSTDTLSARTLRRRTQSEIGYADRRDSQVFDGYMSDSNSTGNETRKKSKKFGFLKRLPWKKRPSDGEMQVNALRLRAPSSEDVRL